MRRLRSFVLVPFVLACLSVVPSLPAHAAGKPTPEQREARALFDQGLALSDEGRWAEALEAFRKSDALVPSISVRFNIAASQRALGKYVDARATIDKAVSDAEVQKTPIKPGLKAEMDKLRGEVDEKIVRIELKTSPASADVSVDGGPVHTTPEGSVELDPGRHVFVIRAEGYDTTTVTKTLGSEDKTLALTAPKTVVVPPPPKESPFYKRPWFWGTVGAVVAAGVAVSVIVVVTGGETQTGAPPPPSTLDRVIPAAVRF